jgi:tripartite-type tricarboxylate transporter receptor subunit TctC
VMRYREAKQVKLLGLSWPKRSPLAPDVPASTEFGLPDFVASAWFAIAAPPGTPSAIVEKLNAAINEVIKMPDVREKFAAQGSEPMAGPPSEMASLLTGERARWKKVIDTAHVKLD